MDVDVDVDEDVDVDREDEAGCMQLSALTLRTHCPAAEGPSSQGASVCHQCAISVPVCAISVPAVCYQCAISVPQCAFFFDKLISRQQTLYCSSLYKQREI